MYLLYLSLSCYILILSVAILSNCNPIEKSRVVLNIFSGDTLISRPILTETNQLLANKFLPIWTVSDFNGISQLVKKEEHVMDNIGPFTFYQDTETNSAVVYFHNRKEFCGTIDSRYFIKDLLWNNNNRDEGKYVTTNNVYERKSARYYDNVIINEPLSISVYSQHYSKQKILNGNIRKNKLSTPKTFYIEVLVIVNYDLARKLLSNKSNEYASVVSYILTLFNSVDMLYSKVTGPIIKMNLAGIIISRKLLSNMEKKCHEIQNNSGGTCINGLNIACVHNFFMNFCIQQENVIPRGFYDIVIFFTRYTLYNFEYDATTGNKQPKILGGLAVSPPNEYYEQIKKGIMRPLIATISDRDGFESFPIIVHEIAHLLTVEHDSPIDKNHIMKSGGRFNPLKLSWSTKSVTQLKKFFESPHSCMFANKPHSLNPGLQKTLDANEQCQCYGYKSAKLTTCGSIVGNFGINCHDNIQCIDDKGKIHEGPIFMDGTPCGTSRICLMDNCVDVNK